MYHSIHTEFIQTPINEILIEGVNACKVIGNGFETYPLSEYILNSIFLKMTGAQEQKFRCVHWEILTNDLEKRSEFIRNRNGLGEYSDYKSKSIILKLINSSIKEKKGGSSNVFNKKSKLISETRKVIEDIFNNTNISFWFERSFLLFKNEKRHLLDNQILKANKDSGVSFFQSSLQKDYDEFVYDYRNRCAHNTTSYQRNLPGLKTLSGEKHPWNNFFYRFSILILIDSILIELYKEYVDLLSKDVS